MNISATEFKARCLDIFDQLAEHRVDRVVVTKRGRPVAVLTPPPGGRRHPGDGLFGFMKGRAIIPEGLDLVESPFAEPLDAGSGVLHR